MYARFIFFRGSGGGPVGAQPATTDLGRVCFMGDGFTILFVDPDRALIDTLGPQMEAEGYTIVHEQSGEDALFSFERFLPQLVIAELDLEGLTGQELCAALKKRTGDYFVPVLFASTVNDAGEKAAGYEAGADDFIAKPFDLRELSARIRSLKKIHAIANRNQSGQLASTYDDLHTHGESALKIIADNLSGGRRVFRLHANGQTAFIATDRRRIIHARVNDLIGRGALEQALHWHAERLEVIEAEVAPNLDADFDDMAAWVLGELDLWRLFTETLMPRTYLRLHPTAAEFAGDIQDEATEIAKAFEQPASIDAVLRGSSADWPVAAKIVADLYYRGFLLYVDGPKPAHGLPLRNALPVSEESISQATQHLEDLQLENLSLGSKIDQLNAENAQLGKQVLEHQKEKDSHTAAAKSLEARASELDEELVALKRRYAARLKDLAAKLGDDASDSIIQQLSFDLQDAHAFAVQVQNAKVAGEKQTVALRKESEALKIALDEATAKLEQLQKQQHSAGQNEGSRLRKLQADNTTLKAQLAESVEARGALQDKLRVMAPNTDDSKLKQLLSEAAALRMELAEAQVRNQQLEEHAKRVDGFSSQQVTVLQAENAELKQRLASIGAEKDAALRQIQTAAAEANMVIRRLEHETFSLRNALAENSTLAGAAQTHPDAVLEVGRLEDEVGNLREQLAGSNREVDRLKATAAQSSLEFSSLQDELAWAKTTLAGLEESSRLAQESQATANQNALRAQEEAGAASSRIADLETLLAEHKAKLATLEQQADQGALDDVEQDGLEEEIALLKMALTEAEVKGEKYQKELEAALARPNEAALRMQADLFSVTADLSQARATIEALEQKLALQAEVEPQGLPLDAEVAFLKAKLTEIQADETAKRQKLADENAGLKERLQSLAAQRQALEDQASRSPGLESAKRMQTEIDTLNDLLERTREANEALSTKLNLANVSAQKNSLLIKAQDQADTIQTLKASLRQRDREFAALQKSLEEESGILDLAEAGTADAAQAEIDDLKKKVDALRMTVLNRDEEIVELTAKLVQ